MLFLELKLVTNNNDICDINFLSQYKVKFDLTYEVPQGFKCQRCGYRKNFCFQERYVKRAGDHTTVKCLRKTRFNC